ncbi:MAG: hypothetical protein PVI90_13890 [Desulfobacteraceae bacterium]|jgi:hypothetical protein
MENVRFLFKVKKFSLICFVLLFTIFLQFTAYGAISEYVGPYSGTYTGEAEGIWILLVDSSGQVDMISWSTVNNTFENGTLTMDEDGNISGTSDMGTQIEAAITSTGHISGTYKGSENSGTMNGNLQRELEQYEGSYSGDYSGSDDEGNWEIEIESTGYVSGNITSSQSGIIIDLMGGINAKGELIAFDPLGIGIFAEIAEGNIIGIWTDTETDTQGQLNGTQYSSSVSNSEDDEEDDNDDNSPGCFISELGL